MYPNKIIQNYKVTHLLGTGGMGEVWAGYHMYMDRKVAIKALLPSLVNNPEIRRRFKQEAVTMSELDHPNIVRLYDYIEEADGLYLVMEFVDGFPLDQYILKKSGPIPEEQALTLFSQMLAGFQYAHSHGVIHRDIKPGNFMITPDKRIKILDFGIAKIVAQLAGQQTKSGVRIGTVLYMSPEQVRGEELDSRSDIYALGVTFFQMLTGQSPYTSNSTEYEVYQSILNTPLPRAATIYPAISEFAQNLIDIATAKNPEDRFQDCQAINQFIFEPEIPSKSHQGRTNKKRKERRRKAGNSGRRSTLKWVFGISLTGALLVIGIVWGVPELSKKLNPVDTHSPMAVAREFLVAIEKRDTTNANRYATEDCKSILRFYWQVNTDKPKNRGVVILKEYNDRGKATVSYRYNTSNKTQELSLILIDNAWFVACTKEGIFEYRMIDRLANP